MKSLETPDCHRLKKVQEFCLLNNPYESSDQNTQKYLQAMSEIHEWHYKESAFYKEFSISNGLSEKIQLNSLSDLEQFPLLPAEFFKTHEVLSIPKEKVFLHLTSSGTTGQKSQIFFDEWSIKAPQRMIDKIFEYNDWVSAKTCDYLLISYETESNSKLGTSYTDNFLCKYAPGEKYFTAIRSTGTGQHEFDPWGSIEFLEEVQERKRPVRIFGFPAFLYFLVKRMKDKGMSPLKLGAESFIFLGGGWKKHSGEEISRPEFRSLVEEYLGIPQERIRDGYGSVEHCIPYIECKHHHFHLPIWSRVIIRDFSTLKKAEYGNPGFLQFLSPYITSVPAHSVMMGDAASLYPAQECGCGLSTEFFVLHGRAGLQKNKSCAIAAAELLKGRG